MQITDPRVPLNSIPANSKAIVLNGPNGDEYLDLPSVVTPNGYVITRWVLSDEEKANLIRGDDIYVTLLSQGSINPMFVSVGPVNWRTNPNGLGPFSVRFGILVAGVKALAIRTSELFNGIKDKIEIRHLARYQLLDDAIKQLLKDMEETES